MAVGMTGRVLAGRYRTIRRLGSGGMATVWLAEDERLRREVAVKRLHGDASDGDVVRRFQREAKLGASLNHPNVVAVYDIAPDDEGVLIVMEYVEGHTLRDELTAGALEVARRVISQPPPDLRDALPGAPAAAAEVLRRALAKEPDHRPASAGALVTELTRAFEE